VVQLRRQHLRHCPAGRKNGHVVFCLGSWDLRAHDNKPSLSRKAHTGEVYSLDFNKKSQYLLLTGGEDGDVNFWDIRNLGKKVRLA
jgi:WD40 repeat protein